MSDTEVKETLEAALLQSTGGQTMALLEKLWRAAGQTQEGFEAIRRGDRKIVLETVIRKLFDKTGRGIPQEGMSGKVVNEDKTFGLQQPPADYVKRLLRLQEFFPLGTRFVTAEEFTTRSEAIIAKLGADDLMRSILKRAHLPIALPHLPGLEKQDYGKTLEEVFLFAVKGSYEQYFANSEEPEKSCTFNNNNNAGELESKVTVVDGSRHDQLIAAMGSGPVVALYFPNPLQGFSITAAREFIALLSPEFLLTGGLDIATAMTAYPDVLARDFQTPGLDMAALQWRSPGYSLVFKARAGSLVFGGRVLVAHGDCSAGLLVLG